MGSAFLRIVAGVLEGTTVPLSSDEPLIIGRNRGDLVMDDPLISGAHCRIVSRGGHFVIQDLNSTNGTMVDGRLVQEARLEAGSEIGVGSGRLILFIGETAAKPEVERDQQEISWLLDEELLPSEGGGTPADLIGQGLRLPPDMNVVVDVVAGPDTGRSFPLTRGSVTVGRRQGDIPLTDVEVSRRHSVVEVFGRDMLFLRDATSTNGTYCNGRRVRVARLRSGDAINCGKTVMRVHLS